MIEEADPDAVSRTAKDRGKDQLGSIGSGNHFVEIGDVEKIFLPEIAKSWGVKEGQIYVLIHSGSRGFGHQVCQDYTQYFYQTGLRRGSCPIDSSLPPRSKAPMGKNISRRWPQLPTLLSITGSRSCTESAKPFKTFSILIPKKSNFSTTSAITSQNLKTHRNLMA